ncbi:MAG: Tol-Pal system protein TolB [Magnetococcales bacterium]|nr:Tol-Pal system protein TolB [Magnetococcales bacterium]
MMRLFFKVVLLPAMMLVSSPLQATLKIDIQKGGLNPLPIALPEFVILDANGTPIAGGDMGQRLAGVVTDDLKASGLFRPLNPSAFMQDSTSLWKTGPRFREWRLVGAEAVVSGAVRAYGGQISVDFFLHDVFQGALIGPGKRFTAPLKDWRHVGHRVADEIYIRLTNEKGYFTSRIAFVAQQGRRKWLALMDQDGANRLDLTQSENVLVLTPKFSPGGDQLFYLSYEKGPPRIFRWDLYTGRRFMEGDHQGLNATPAWSPDGGRMALTLTKDGNAEVYVKDLNNNTLTRMTQNNAIDTSPSWSPDGQQLVFNSDRAGTPQLYIMSSQGGQARRITYEGQYNAAPAWSPRGDLIAFVQGGRGKFRIAVTDPDGRRVRTLTDSWMDESPAWSPNGRVILFSRQRGDRTQLYTIDLTGHNERLVPIGDGLGGSDPSWSPLIR